MARSSSLSGATCCAEGDTHETSDGESNQGIGQKLSAFVVVNVGGLFGVVEEQGTNGDLGTDLNRQQCLQHAEKGFGYAT